MFWGLLLKSNKKYSQTVSKSFHVSQAALDVTSCSSSEPVQIILTWDKSNYILCTLRKNKTEQVPLDLNFAEGDNISFMTQGDGNVHLSGYFMLESDNMSDTSSENEDLFANESHSSQKVSKRESDEDDDLSTDSNEEGEEDEEIVEPKAKVAKTEKQPNRFENGKQPKTEKPTKGGKMLQGGVKIVDLKVGDGNEAKAGKKVQVYYEGRLKTNGKVFDSSKSGSGFKFLLGRGEVIKGWDVGVAGMKVGGKRRIICPPNMAYGSKGSPPVIPPNSTLEFEVELRNIQ